MYPGDHFHPELSKSTTFRQLDNVVHATSKCCGARSPRFAASGAQCLVPVSMCGHGRLRELSLYTELQTQHQHQSKHRESDCSGKAQPCDRQKWCSQNMISAKLNAAKYLVIEEVMRPSGLTRFSISLLSIQWFQQQTWNIHGT